MTELRLVAGQLSSRRDSSNNRLIQWGIVGTGPMAERFARALNASPSSNVRSVCSRTSSKAALFAKRHGAVACYEGINAFADGEAGIVDVAYIATPLEAHYDQAKCCLERGINVLCEKPLCELSAQVGHLYNIAERRGVVLAEAMWSWCLPTYKQALRWISAGRIGQLESIRVFLCKDEPNPNKSVMNDYGTYAVAFVIRFAGPELSVKRCVRKNYPGTDIDCGWEVQLESVDGVAVELKVDASSSAASDAVIKGSRGSIVFDTQFNRTNVISLFDNGGVVVERCKYDYRSEGYEFQIDDTEALIRDKAAITGFNVELSFATARLREELFSTTGEK